MVAALALLGGTARAAEVAHEDVPATSAFPFSNYELTGPVFAGDRVVWATGQVAGTWRIRSARPGEALTTVSELPIHAPEDSYVHWVALYGSPTRLVWRETLRRHWDDKYGEDDPLLDRVVAGPPGGPFSTVAGCAWGDRACLYGCLHTGGLGRSSIMRLDGDALVFRDTCDPSGASTAVRVDLASGVHETVRPADGSAAGSYPAPAPGGWLDNQAVDTDGTLVGRLVDPGRYVPEKSPVQWLRPGDPVAHTLPFHLNTDEGAHGALLAIAHGRVVARVGEARQRLVVADLATGAVRTLVRFGRGTAARPAPFPGGFAFDGERVAWASTQCERLTISVTPVDAPAVDAPSDMCVFPRVLTRVAGVSTSGRFAIRLTCREGCRGTLRLRSKRLTITRRFAFGEGRVVRRIPLRMPRRLARTLRTGGFVATVALNDSRATARAEVGLRAA